MPCVCFDTLYGILPYMGPQPGAPEVKEMQFDEKKLRFHEFLFLTKEGMFVLKLTQPIYPEIVAIAVHITNRNFPL